MDEEIFPLEDVTACVEDERLQAANRVEHLDPDLRESLDAFRRATLDRGAPESARWIYFRSPDWTWERLCGREGYLLFEVDRLTQHAFYVTTMN